MITAIVFILYLILFSWLITRIKFFTKSGIPKLWLIILFNLKIAAGLAYAWFYSQPQYYASSDTWSFFNQGCTETDVLLKDPAYFFKDLLSYGYQGPGNLFGSTQSYWNNLKTNVVIKLVAIFNVFTFKNYWANIIFFNFLFFFGPVALYRLATEHIQTKRWIITALVFCIPSFLFWYSGAHKDGLIYSFFMLSVFYSDKLMHTKKGKYWVFLFLTFVILFTLRNYFLVLMIPAFSVWLLCKKHPFHASQIIALVYGFCLLLFLISPMFGDDWNILKYLKNKQADFVALGGNSQIILPAFQASTAGFFRFLPFALDIAFLRPHLNEFKNIAYLPAITENVLLYASLVWVGYKLFTSSSKIPLPPLFLFFLCFSLSFLLLSGFTVTLTGAIVRYRAFVLPLFTVSMAAYMHREN